MASLRLQLPESTIMHEVGIAQNILDQVLANASREKALRICRIKLRIGDLSGVVEEALRFALKAGVRDTLAEQAEIELEKVKALCHCSDCKKEFEPSDAVFMCPHCGRLSITILKGRELELVELEVE